MYFRYIFVNIQLLNMHYKMFNFRKSPTSNYQKNSISGTKMDHFVYYTKIKIYPYSKI